MVQKFGEDEWLDPPTKSIANPNYATTHDRGGQEGPNVWDQAPPNGTIRVPDIVVVVSQFGHDCA